jgi:putative ABC transport system ATP-binding protein
VGEPALILADEPTGSLDASLRDEAMNALLEVTKDKTLILVTHDPTIAQCVECQLQLTNGHLVTL